MEESESEFWMVTARSTTSSNICNKPTSSQDKFLQSVLVLNTSLTYAYINFFELNKSRRIPTESQWWPWMTCRRFSALSPERGILSNVPYKRNSQSHGALSSSFQSFWPFIWSFFRLAVSLTQCLLSLKFWRSMIMIGSRLESVSIRLFCISWFSSIF